MPGGLERDANTERNHEQGVHKMNAGGELARGSYKERNQNTHTAARFHPVAACRVESNAVLFQWACG